MKVTLDLFSKAGKTVRKTEGSGFCRGPVSSRPFFITDSLEKGLGWCQRPGCSWNFTPSRWSSLNYPETGT